MRPQLSLLLPALSTLAGAELAAQKPLEASASQQTSKVGDFIPSIGFGTWNLKGPNVSEAVSYAIQAGYRHIDCAVAYGNQEEVGRGIADGLNKTGLKREDLWITSKLWNNQYEFKPSYRLIANCPQTWLKK